MKEIRESRRISLQEELEDLLRDKLAILDDGSPAIYFQPPENVKLKYPCLIYSRDTDYFRHANDTPYFIKPQYEVTIISRDPDNNIADIVVEHFKYCRHNRRFMADNLIHDSLGLYY